MKLLSLVTLLGLSSTVSTQEMNDYDDFWQDRINKKREEFSCMNKEYPSPINLPTYL